MNSVEYATEQPLAARLADMGLGQIAAVISSDWKNPYFGAVPYIDAMKQLSGMRESFGLDPAHMIVRYFLSNAGTWRGTVAREVKAELNSRL